jgi:hypothetical protein
MRRGALTVVLSLVVALLAVGGAIQASADSVTDIGMTGFRDIIVDEAHDHVYVSQGNATLIVTDLQGVPITTIEGLHGAAGMTLSPDGSTLYVALSSGDAIAAVDPDTLEVANTYPTGTASCPSDVAITVGLVWFGGGCSSRQAVSALDPTDGSVTATSVRLQNPLLRTSPQLPGQVFTVERGISPTTLYAYTAQGGDSPSLSLRTSRWNTGENTRDLAITPDGNKVIQASGYPYQHNAFSTNDLSSAGSYGSSNYPNAVAVRDDGMVAAGIDASSDADVYVYREGSTTLFRSYNFGDDKLYPGGLAFGTTNLYAVVGDPSWGTRFRLQVIRPMALPSLALATDKSTYVEGETARVKAKLVADSSNQTVSIYSEVQGERTLLASGPVDAVSHELTTDLVVTEPTTIVAEYAGDETYAAATASTAVDMQLRDATVRLTTTKPSYRYGEKAGLTVRLSTASSNRTVEVYRVVGGNQTLLETSEVPVDGALRLSSRVSERTTFQVTYGGDEGTRTATASVTVPVAARVSAHTVGSEGRSGRYHLYAAGHGALVGSSVSPNHAGDCLYFRTQYLVHGVFRYDDVSRCARMDSASDAGIKFSTTREARGHAIRVRAEWRGDRRSKASASDWQYIRFT